MTPVSYTTPSVAIPESGQAMIEVAMGDDSESWEIARRLVAARLGAYAEPLYPGSRPPTLEAGYAVQDAAIALWPSRIMGWKVGRIPDEWAARMGEERLVGPIFEASIRIADAGAPAVFPAISGGFAAVEAEFVFRIGRDAPRGKIAWTDEEALGHVDALHIGVELAGSPLPDINDLGPAVVVSDFGNNAGLIVGPAIRDWRRVLDEDMVCACEVDGSLAGRGSASGIHGGLAAALRFALARCARRGMPLLAGQWVSTGAATGIHEVRSGQRARALFDGVGAIEVRVATAQPRSV